MEQVESLGVIDDTRIVYIDVAEFEDGAVVVSLGYESYGETPVIIT